MAIYPIGAFVFLILSTKSFVFRKAQSDFDSGVRRLHRYWAVLWVAVPMYEIIGRRGNFSILSCFSKNHKKKLGKTAPVCTRNAIYFQQQNMYAGRRNYDGIPPSEPCLQTSSCSSWKTLLFHYLETKFANGNAMSTIHLLSSNQTQNKKSNLSWMHFTRTLNSRVSLCVSLYVSLYVSLSLSFH